VGREESPYAKDPNCGMQVEKAHAPATLVTRSGQYWFCCDGCRDRFAATVPIDDLHVVAALTVHGSDLHDAH
jgi:YHS domain-containing protein